MDYTVAFSAHDSIFNGSSFTFKLNSDCWFTNLAYQKIEVDPDGNGYRQIALGGTVTASYSGIGRREVKLKVTLTNNQVLLAHTSINVNAQSTMSMLTNTGGIKWEGQEIGSPYLGVTTKADVFSLLRDGTIRDPLIVVEGFDPRIGDDYGFTTIYQFYKNLKGGFDNVGVYADSILANYDIIYVDWVNSEEYIQANANTLKEVIRWVNLKKASSGSTSPNVIMGTSMGGLVARYALKAMENANETHQTSVYVSHDSPHLGATIPVGALYALHGIGSFMENKLNLGSIYNRAAGTTLEYMLKQVHSNAAKQMLVNYVDFGGNLNNTAHNTWQQELANLGFPQGDPNASFRMISIANGSYTAESTPQSYLTAYASASTDLFDVANLLAGGGASVMLGILLNDLWAGMLSIIPGKTTLKGALEIFPGTSTGNKVTNLNFKFIKKFLWTLPITRTIFSYEKYMPGGLTFDIFPSSSYPTNHQMGDSNPFIEEAPILGKYSYEVSTSESIPFIPTSSALAVGNGTQPLTTALFTMKPSAANTPFGENVLIAELLSNTHTHLKGRELEWLFVQLKMGIHGPKLGATGSLYSMMNAPSGSITWSSSNPSIATISQSGVLTVIGKGVLDIIAQVDNQKVSTKIAVGIPRFVLAEVTRDPGFYTIEAQCIDTEPGYADFILNNRDNIVFSWGIKRENQSIEWLNSGSQEIKLSTTEDNENTTIYMKVRDANDNESTPVFVRITGYDIYEVGYKTFIINKDGVLYTSTGSMLPYNIAALPVFLRSTSIGEFGDAKWSPRAGIMVNEDQMQWVIPWISRFYIKDVIPLAEVRRITSEFANDQVGVFTFLMLNFNGEIIQKTPISIIYKENYPN